MCAFYEYKAFTFFSYIIFELIIPSKLFHFNKKKDEKPNLLLCGL